MIRKDVIFAVLATFCLTTILFTVIPVGSYGTYDPWIDFNDDGKIDVKDVSLVASNFGSKGTPINKTKLLLELQQRIDLLNQTLIEQQEVINDLIETVLFLNSTRGLGLPDYDSGWVLMSQEEELTLAHNLNTTDLLVYIVGKLPSGIHQIYYGCCHATEEGLYWEYLSNTTITMLRAKYDVHWGNGVRVRIWKIP
jgi:hypothetical protein